MSWGFLKCGDPPRVTQVRTVHETLRECLALPTKPTADAPTVYFDQPSKIQFPPRCVMPVNELRAIVLEFVSADSRPASVEWLPVNDLRWELDDGGDIAT